MVERLEWSQAVAETVARCRPAVVAARLDPPRSRIVETLSGLVTTGDLDHCEYLLVDLESNAVSACIAASAAGGRAYTAAPSQGLPSMTDALQDASGLGLPLVMTAVDRTIEAPLDVWHDHPDAMSQHDTGWIQLFASSRQEAVDLHVQAFAIAERTSLPVMVCVSGSVVSHAMEELEVPDQADVDRFLPPSRPRRRLASDGPAATGAMAGSELFTEARYLAARRQLQALATASAVAAEFQAAFGRASGGLVQPYRTGGAEVVLVVRGSVFASAADVVDDLRDEGVAAGVLGITCFRPWPAEAVHTALLGVPRVVVLDRATAVGPGGVLGTDVRLCAPADTTVHQAVAGLGGRPVPHDLVRRLLRSAAAGRLPTDRVHCADVRGDVLAGDVVLEKTEGVR